MTKFGQTLKSAAHPPWASKYVRYKALKKVIKCIIAATAATGAPGEPGAAALPLTRVLPILALLKPSELANLKAACVKGLVTAAALEQFFLELIDLEIDRVAETRWRRRQRRRRRSGDRLGTVAITTGRQEKGRDHQPRNTTDLCHAVEEA